MEYYEMRTLGLDVGINSIGFSLVDLKIEKLLSAGVHLFDRAENPKDGASLALPRRLFRGQRRVIRRRMYRKRLIKSLLEQQEIPTFFINEDFTSEFSPWQLRADVLERRLTPLEFGQVLYHLAKRRGFKSNRKDGSKNNDEAKKMLSKANALVEAMKEENYETIGSYLASLPKQRNGNDDYSHTVLRALVEDETHIIFDKQRQFDNTLATKTLEQQFLDYSLYQRSLHSVKDKVGKCGLEQEEFRAPRFSYSGELFVLWQRINNIRVKYFDDSERALDEEERMALFMKCHKTKGIKYKHIRECIEERDLGFLIKAPGLSYSISNTKKTKKTEIPEELPFDEMVKKVENSKFLELTGFHTLKEIFNINEDNLNEINMEQWDLIADILSFEKNPDIIHQRLIDEAQPLNDEQINALSEIDDFKGTVGHSAKAIQKLLPFLADGYSYDKAVVEAGYTKEIKNHKGKLPPFEKTNNPVVDRALAQCRKVINAIIQRYGMPDTIHVEMARDLGRSFEDRKKIEGRIHENQEQNKRLYQEMLDDIGGNIGLKKYKLWKEMKGYCPYSGIYIEPKVLMDSLATQMDHILPHSRTFDDGFTNLVLCLSTENQRKGNDTPWEYFSSEKSEEDWDALEGRIKHLPWQKRRRFLVKNMDEDQEGSWKERHLNDTRYMARYLKNHIEEHLDFSSSTIDKKRRVLAINGRITATLRRQWGLHKDRDESARHHAQDAIVIACANQGMVNAITNYKKYEARHHEIEVPKPWDGFRNDVLEAIKNIFVSRMANRKMSGELHQQTIRSLRETERVFLNDLTAKKLESLTAKEDENKTLYEALKQQLKEHDNKPEEAFKEPFYFSVESKAEKRPIKTVELEAQYTVQKVKLSSLTSQKLEDLVDKERNKVLYNTLKQRLDEHNGKADKAFKEPIYMPTKSGEQGPVIHSVRIRTNDKSGIPIRGGLASNGDMLRVDIFEKADKHYLCPVYTWHAYDEELPSQVIKVGKDESYWPILDDSYQFKFSLYKNDLARIVDKQGQEYLGYYLGTDRANAQITLLKHDGNPQNKEDYRKSIGVQSLQVFEKYTVNCFGERHLIQKETRLGLANPSRSKSGIPKPQTTAVTM